jgi:hypothetical protein
MICRDNRGDMPAILVTRRTWRVINGWSFQIIILVGHKIYIYFCEDVCFRAWHCLLVPKERQFLPLLPQHTYVILVKLSFLPQLRLCTAVSGCRDVGIGPKRWRGVAIPFSSLKWSECRIRTQVLVWHSEKKTNISCLPIFERRQASLWLKALHHLR